MALPNTLGGDQQTALVELRSVATVTEERLARLFDEEEEVLAQLDPSGPEPLHALRDLVLCGGKRLRPAFCHWGHRATTDGAEATGSVVEVGAALELLHAFALAHDDVMDESPDRRGRPTTHVVHAERHRRHGWRGAPDRHGENVAILVGDLGHTLARRLVRGAPEPALRLWDVLETELVIGQYLDVTGTAAGATPLDRALRIADLKSARYTVARPLALGAALGGGRTPPALQCYGEAIGLAFQLRDDLLGAFGTSDVTGKPAGDDLVAGKPTPLMAIAVAEGTPAQRAVLATVGSDDVDVARVQQVLADTGARRITEDRIWELTERGGTAVSDPGSGLHPPTARLLVEVAELLCTRQA